MSVINVTVTNAGVANVSVSNGSTVNATVGNGGAVNVTTGTISPGNATVVSGTLTINSTTTLAPGSNATVTNKGTAYAAVLDIGIPTGAAGPTGTQGPPGQNGVTPSFAIGSVVTGAAGSSASVTATPSNGGANVTLDLTIPRGDTGASGANGSSLTLSDATPSALGTASAGTSSTSSRSDHVHQLPVLVSAVNNLTGNLTLAAGPNVTITPSGSVLTIGSVGGLGVNAAIDGGDYTGEILGGISFSAQPQSVTTSSAITFGNWTSTSGGNLTVVGAIAGSPSNVMALGLSGTYPNVTYHAAISSDGDSWSVSNATIPFTGSAGQGSTGGSKAMSAVWDGSRWIALDNRISERLLTVSSGGTISQTTSPKDVYPVECIAYGNGTIMAASSRRAFRSQDLVNWTSGFDFGNVSGGFMTPSACYSLNTFFICGPVFTYAVDNGQGYTNYLGFAILRSSDNGATWTRPVFDISNPNASGLLSSIAASPSAVVALATSTKAYVSTNGTTWTAVTLPRASRVVRWTGTRFVAFDSNATYEYIWSVNGSTWSVGSMPSTAYWWDAAGSAAGVLAGIATQPLGVGAPYYSVLGQLSFAPISTSTASANLTSSAASSSGGTVSYQWQSSIDAGATWSNVAGATASTLALTGLTPADTGKRYRVAASAVGAATVYSQTAILTVTG